MPSMASPAITSWRACLRLDSPSTIYWHGLSHPANRHNCTCIYIVIIEIIVIMMVIIAKNKDLFVKVLFVQFLLFWSCCRKYHSLRICALGSRCLEQSGLRASPLALHMYIGCLGSFEAVFVLSILSVRWSAQALYGTTAHAMRACLSSSLFFSNHTSSPFCFP